MTDSHYLGWVVLCGPTIAPVSPPAPVVPVVTVITSHTGHSSWVLHNTSYLLSTS